MRAKYLLILTGISVFLFQKDVLATDSLSVNYSVKLVKIGPQELNPMDLIEPEVLRKMQIEALLRSRNKQQEVVKSLQNRLVLEEAMAENEISSEPNLEHALEEYRGAGNWKRVASINSSLGVFYAGKNDLTNAIYNFNEALKLYELLKDKASVIKTLHNLSALYKASGQFKKAITQSHYLIQQSPGIDNFAVAGSAYLEVAENNFLLKEYDLAEQDILKKALPMFRRIGNKVGRMKCFQNLATLYFVQKRYTEAKWFNIQANIMADKLNDREAKIENLIKLAEVKFAIGEVEMAISDFRQAEDMAVEHRNLVKLVKIKGDLGELYHSLGDFTAAGTELKEYNRLSSNLFKSAGL